MFTTFTATFQQKTFLTPRVISCIFDFKNITDFDFAPGQYVILHVPQKEAESARRMYSLVNSPDAKDSFELLAQLIPGGVASEYFLKMQKGEEVSFQGPAGVFVLKKSDKDKIFIATGTGIAPTLSILRSHLKEYPDARFTLFWGLKKFTHVYYLDELKALAHEYAHFNFTVCLSREESLEQAKKDDRQYFDLGRVTKKIDELVHRSQSTVHSADFYICGDRNIVESLRQHALDKGIEKSAISFEKFV